MSRQWTVAMEKAVYGGDCLGRTIEPPEQAGKTVFLPLTLPGERIGARITEDKRSFSKGEAEAILVASPHRVEPHCPHFGACGGCHYQHAEYSEQLVLKQQALRETLARAGVPVPHEIGVLATAPEQAWGYRNRIRLALTPAGELAYRGRRSHDLIAVRECPIAAPVLLETAQHVARFLAGNAGQMILSEMELFTSHDESEVLLTLFAQSAEKPAAERWLAALRDALPRHVTGIRVELAENSLQPPMLAALGQSSLQYNAGSVAYRVDHGAFFQVNRHLLDAFIGAAVPEDGVELAWDLYAGVGLFARRLAANCERVLAVEIAPASLAALEQNLGGAKAQAIASSTLDFLWRNREQREARPGRIVLDPPRAGLGVQVTQLLNAISAPEMIYVSCDPVTLARDLRQLTEERYRIESVTLADMFPQTFHIETVVRLRRT